MALATTVDAFGGLCLHTPRTVDAFDLVMSEETAHHSIAPYESSRRQ